MSETKRPVILTRITEGPFNSDTLDDVVRACLGKAKSEAKGLILVLTDASGIKQFKRQVEAASAAVAGIGHGLLESFTLEAAYYLASQRLNTSVRKHGGKPFEMHSDHGGPFVFGKQPTVDADILIALAVSDYTVVVIPPASAMGVDAFMELLTSYLGTPAIKY